jgi:hypothetical protein
LKMYLKSCNLKVTVLSEFVYRQFGKLVYSFEFSLDDGFRWMSKVWSICKSWSMRANLSYAFTSGKVRKHFSPESTPISNKLLAQSIGARNAISAQFCPLGLTTMCEPILSVDFWISKQNFICGILMLIWMLGRYDRISSIR